MLSLAIPISACVENTGWNCRAAWAASLSCGFSGKPFYSFLDLWARSRACSQGRRGRPCAALLIGLIKGAGLGGIRLVSKLPFQVPRWVLVFCCFLLFFFSRVSLHLSESSAFSKEGITFLLCRQIFLTSVSRSTRSRGTQNRKVTIMKKSWWHPC